jgi:hypothetical protein
MGAADPAGLEASSALPGVIDNQLNVIRLHKTVWARDKSPLHSPED